MGVLDMSNIQITTRSISNSIALKNHIHKYFEKIQRLYKQITQCHVVIDVAQKHNRTHMLFTVNIDIVVHGKEIVVSQKQNNNLYIAICDAFNALERLLNKRVKRKHSYIDKYEKYKQIENTDMLNIVSLESTMRH
jgi:ribosomal subunit interface protein